MPVASVEIDKQLDWLLIRHDDSEATEKATQKAFQYLRALKQSIPTPGLSVSAAPAVLADDEDIYASP